MANCILCCKKPILILLSLIGGANFDFTCFHARGFRLGVTRGLARAHARGSLEKSASKRAVSFLYFSSVVITSIIFFLEKRREEKSFVLLVRIIIVAMDTLFYFGQVFAYVCYSEYRRLAYKNLNAIGTFRTFPLVFSHVSRGRAREVRVKSLWWACYTLGMISGYFLVMAYKGFWCEGILESLNVFTFTIITVDTHSEILFYYCLFERSHKMTLEVGKDLGCRGFKRTISEARTYYMYLVKIFNLMTFYLGGQILTGVTILAAMAILVGSAYSLSYQLEVDMGTAEIMMIQVMLVVCTIASVRVAKISEDIREEVNKLASFLFRLPISRMKYEEAAEVELFINTLHVMKPVLRVAGLFNLDANLIASVTGTIVTYILVSLQLQITWNK